MAVYKYDSRVAYDDIDRDLNLSMRGALRQMQEAALLDADKAGYSVTNVEDTGVVWLLVSWRVRLLKPCPWNTNIQVRTWARTMERLKSERDYEILDDAGQVVAQGESLWILVNVHTGHPTRITQAVKDAYELTDRKVFADEPAPLSEGVGEIRRTYEITHRDLDTNIHMNNRVYLEVARDSLPGELQNREFREFSIHYHRQLLLGDRVQCRYRREGARHIVDLTGEDPKHLHATVVFCEEAKTGALQD